MDTAIVVTDAGRAHIKVMRNNEGPHALACELVCTQLAEWFKLPTLERTIIVLEDCDTFDLNKGRCAHPGSAFSTRTVPNAHPWSGAESELKRVINREAITRLVIFDTWIRNDDRYPPQNDAGQRQSDWTPRHENVLLAQAPGMTGKLRLIAMDFSRGLTRGKELPGDLAAHSARRDENIYGLFPEFKTFVKQDLVDGAVKELKMLKRGTVENAVQAIPEEWEVSASARRTVGDFLCERASYLADTIKARLAPLCYAQEELPFEETRSQGEA